MTDDDATPEQVEEGEAQRGLRHDDPDDERARAGIDGAEGREPEPLPDEPRNEQRD